MGDPPNEVFQNALKNPEEQPASRLPSELRDSIISLLRYQKESLMQCSLVSKSWVPYTRKYLFGEITILLYKTILKWKEAFPDPARSPTRYTHTLDIQNISL